MSTEPGKLRHKAAILGNIRKDLMALARTPPRSFSAKEAVRESMPQILEARRSGRSVSEIALLMQKNGGRITDSTLAAYLRKLAREEDHTDVALEGRSRKVEAAEKAIGDADGGAISSIEWRSLDDDDGTASARIDRILAFRQKDIQPNDLERVLSDEEDHDQ